MGGSDRETERDRDQESRDTAADPAARLRPESVGEKNLLYEAARRGMTLAIVGLLLFTRFQAGGDYLTDLLPGVMLASIGMGLTFALAILLRRRDVEAVAVGEGGLATEPTPA